MVKIYSVIAVFHEVSGVQKVLLDIHNGLKNLYHAKIAGFCPYNDIALCMNIKENEYVQIKSIRELRDSIVITHERITSSKCFLLNKVFSLNIKQIHVQHSIYNTLNFASFYPKTVVSISDKITQNLISYFKISPDNIFKIHNGVKDEWGKKNKMRKKDGFIRIAYIARIDSLKCQTQIVNNFKDKLSDKVKIDFIGNGPLLNELINITKDSDNFSALGFRCNIVSLLVDYDYVMLFSEKEGLPITLIEGAMSYKPLIVNDIGGCLEIGIPSENAFYAKDWEALKQILNSLEFVSSQEYERMALRSRQVYEDKFTYNVMMEKYIELIHHVMQK